MQEFIDDFIDFSYINFHENYEYWKKLFLISF